MKKQITSKISNSLFEYDNYRTFLDDYIQEQKMIRHGFTISAFSKKCGFSSHSFLRFIIKGERNLSDKSITTMCKTIEFSCNQCEYFRALVHFNQSDKPGEKAKFFDDLKELRKVIKTTSLDDKYSKFYEKWYYPVVKEVAVSTTWGGNFKNLGNMLSPKITFFQAKEAIEYLLEVGLLEKESNGTYTTGAKHVNSDDIPLIVKKEARREVLQMGVDAVDNFDITQRHTAYTTLTLDKEAYEDIEKMLNEIRKKIIKRADSSKNGDVYEAILQLFPVTQINKKDLKSEKD